MRVVLHPALISRRRGWRGERSALALRLNLLAADARLQLEQLQLQIAELLAVLAVLGDERKTKTLFQNLYLQLRILKLARGRLHLAGLCVELLCLGVELLLQLRNERGNDGIGVRRNSRLRRRTHDASLIADRSPACKRNMQCLCGLARCRSIFANRSAIPLARPCRGQIDAAQKQRKLLTTQLHLVASSIGLRPTQAATLHPLRANP